jgi:uncharacterized protein (TIGR02145 family)
MKKHLYIFLVLLFPVIVFSQNVGIGTSTPPYKLSLKVNGAGFSHEAENTLIRIGTYVDSIYGAYFQTHTNHPLNFAAANGVGHMTIMPNGNVGIGITSPLEKLHVNGNLKVAGIISGVTDPLAPQDAATKAYVDQMSEIMLDAGLNGVVEDIDGNKYKTIKIGTQVWMADNLKTTKYNDGTVIPEVTVDTDWEALSTPAYSWYSNDSISNAKLFGALYNYYTVADTNSLNVCPTGWDVPTVAEWIILEDYIEDNSYGYGGSGDDIGKSMAATFRWESSSNAGDVGNDTGSNNNSGFSGLPGGRRIYDGEFSAIGIDVYWWSSTENSIIFALIRRMYNYNDILISDITGHRNGLSVRCLRD